jgi:CRP-like cAMP-binding protein
MSRAAFSSQIDYSNSFHAEKHATVADPWKEFETPLLAYPAGAELFGQGSKAEEVFCIDSGIIKLMRLESDGQELIVDLRFPEWLVGAAAVIMEEPYPVTAVTVTPCRLRRISAGVFRYLLKSEVELSWRVHRMHSRKVYDQVTRISQLACLPARHRVEYFFVQLLEALGINSQQKDITLPLLLKNSEIAALVAVTPEYFSRMLKQMQLEGLIRAGKGHLTIPDPQKLGRPA